MFSLAIFNTQPPHIYFGGVERRIIEVSKRLSSRVDVTIYCGAKAGFSKPLNLSGVKVFPLFSTDLFFPLDNWFFNCSVQRGFSRIRTDVLEAHTVSGYGVLRAMEEHKVKKPLIQVVHGVLADEYAQSSRGVHPTLRTKASRLFMRYLSRLEMEAARKATLVVAVSKYSSQRMVELYGVEEDKVRVVPNGVDPKVFRPLKGLDALKRKLGIQGKRCVLFVGSLTPRKGVHFLIEAAKHVLVREKDTVFLVVGEGPLKRFLISYSKRLGARRNFIFIGKVSDEILPQIYNCADIFVLPSLQEGQGITLLEAQACAKPVIAFNVGGVGECVKHGETGLLIKPESFKLGDAIIKLLRDEALRVKMGASGRRFVCESFSWDVTAEKMFDTYVEAIEKYK